MISILKSVFFYFAASLFLGFCVAAHAAPILSPEWSEVHRLVPMDSSSAQLFDQYCRALITEHDPQAIKHGLDQTVFILLAKPQPEASFNVIDETFLGKHVQKKLIVLSQGTFAKMKFEEEFIALLGHEWFHRAVYRTNAHNTKTEEALADVAPFEAMARAKRNPEIGLKFFAEDFFPGRQLNEHGKIVGEWITDVHPLDHNRLKAITQAVGKLAFDYGGFEDIAPRPLPDFFLRLQKSARPTLHRSFIDQALAEDRWSRSTFAEKLQMLEGFFASNLDESNSARQQDFAGRINDLKPSNDTEKEELRVFIEKKILPLFDVNAENQIRPMFAATLLKTIQKQKVFGDKNAADFLFGENLYQLSQLSKEFVEAGSGREAKKAAKAFIEIFKKMEHLVSSDHLNPLIIDAHLMGEFEFPELEDFEARVKRRQKTGKGSLPRVSWQNHFLWAEDDASHVIRDTLVIIGIHDHRLFEEPFSDSAPTTLAQLAQGSSTSIDELRISENGSVKSISWLVTKRKKQKPFKHGLTLDDLVRQDLEDYWSRVRGRFRKIVEAGSYGGSIKGSEVIRFSEDSSYIRDFHLFFQEPYAYTLANYEGFEELFLARWNMQTDGAVEATEQDLVNLFKQASTAEMKGFVKNFYLRSPPEKAEGQIFPYELFAEKTFQEVEFEEKKIDLSPLDTFLLSHWKDFLSPLQFIESLDHFHLLEPELKPIDTVLKAAAESQGFDISRSEKAMGEAFRKWGTHKSPSMNKLAMLSLYRYLEKNKKKLSPKLILDTIAVIGSEKLKQYSYLMSMFRQHVAAIKKYPEDLEELTKTWRDYHEAELFPYDGGIESAVLSTILTKISHLPDANDRLDRLFTILTLNRSITRPEGRMQLIEAYNSNLLEIYGIDDGSKLYFGKLKRVIAKLSQKVPASLLIELFTDLAERLEAQKPLCDFAREHLQNSIIESKNRGSLDNKEQEIFGEWSLLQIQKSEDLRKKSIRFLASDGSEGFAIAYGKDTLHLAREKFDGVLNRNIQLTPEDGRDRALSFYENFWGLAFPARVAVLDHILFPMDPNAMDYEAIDQKMLSFAVETVFPLEAEYAAEAREFLEAYLPGLEKTQRGLFVAALLSAQRKVAAEGIEKRFLVGRQLAQILDFLGPTETKLSQAIHSYPDTPQDIRVGMNRSKSMANPPATWEIHDLIAELLPPSLSKRITHVGTLQGAASFFVVVEVRLDDGKSYVLKLLRPHSPKRMETGFRRLAQMLDRLKLKLNHSTYEALKNLISQAKQQSQREIDPKLFVELHNELKVLYEADITNLKKGRVLHSRVAQLHESGEGWALLEKAPGEDFIKVDAAIQKEFAAEYVFQILLSILRGGRFDTDRHGGQSRLSETQRLATLFDPGGIILDTPNTEDRAALAELLLELSRDLSRNKELKQHILTDKLQEMILSRKAQDLSIDYLQAVQTALLKTHDYFIHLSSGDVKEVVNSLIHSGHIHPEIQSHFFQKMQALPAAESAALLSDFRAETQGCYQVFFP